VAAAAEEHAAERCRRRRFGKSFREAVTTETMKTRTLGQGLEVSALGLGCMG
jgi:hypothetical protein